VGDVEGQVVSMHRTHLFCMRSQLGLQTQLVGA